MEIGEAGAITPIAQKNVEEERRLGWENVTILSRQMVEMFAKETPLKALTVINMTVQKATALFSDLCRKTF